MTPEDFGLWGWRIPFLASIFLIVAGFIIRSRIEEPPVFFAVAEQRDQCTSPGLEAVKAHWPNMIRVAIMSWMNVIPIVTTVFGMAYAVQPSYGIRFTTDVFLWVPVLGNVIAVFIIPFVGHLSDKIGRRPPIIVGAVTSGLMAYVYLYAISLGQLGLALFAALLMWGVLYQGYNATFPSFFPELFPARSRVSGMAIAQNIGTSMTAMLPALFVAIAPPGSSDIPLKIGSITLALTLIAALTAWSAAETYRSDLEDNGLARDSDLRRRTASAAHGT